MKGILFGVGVLALALVTGPALGQASLRPPVGYEEALTPDFTARDLKTFQRVLGLDAEQTPVVTAIYDDYEAARAMQERIRRDFGLGQAYVVPYRSGAR